MKIVLAALVVLAGMQSFADDVEKIIGNDDLIAVNAEGSNVPAGYRPLLNAFGLMSMGCTATHIGNGYVLTAGHCFYADETLIQDQECSDITIEWGVREGATPVLKSTCEKIVASRRDDVSDYAIIKVSPVPEASVGIELNRRAAYRQKLTIFSHPEELPLRWSQTCVVESKLDPTFSPKRLQHKCDTNPGSSGATILDARTGKVIGIHDGGRLTTPTDGMNYGTYLTNSEVAGALRKLGFR